MNANALYAFPYLAFLVAISQDLQAVGSDGQKLDVGISQQGHHLLQASSQAHRHLGTLLVQQKVVECGDGVEQHTVHWRAGETETKFLLDNFNSMYDIFQHVSHQSHHASLTQKL